MFRCFEKDKFYLPQIEGYEQMPQNSNNGIYVESIFEVLKDNNYFLYSMYKQDEKMFAIFIQQYSYPSKNNEYWFHTYELPVANFNKVCSSNIQIHKQHNEIYIFDLDTYKKYRRKGHASKLITLYKQFADTLDISTLKGEILPDSDIGYENLKLFYEKNGFIVNGYDIIFSK